MGDNDTTNLIERLLESQVQCVLATGGAQGPATHLMAYAYSAGLAHIFVASRPGTAKVANMRERPAVSLLWDNRTGNLEDHRGGAVLTAGATARELAGAGAGDARTKLLARNPNLEDLLNTPGTAVFELAVIQYSIGIGYADHHTYTPRTGA